MSITPRLKCPPDYSILSFRLVDCKKVGIVKGINKEVDVDLKDFFIPVTEYSERRINLKAGQIQRIDAGNLFNYGEQNEEYAFVPDSLVSVADQTTHKLEIFSDEDGTLIYSGSFLYTYDPVIFPTFLDALKNFYDSDNALKALFNLKPGDTTKQSFSLSSKIAGLKYCHLFTFNSASLAPFLHPGNLSVPYRKWENGRLKIIFILAHYADKFTPTNQKNFQWIGDDDYQRLSNPKKWNTKILCNADSNYTTFQWQDTFDVDGNLTSYNTRLPYHIYNNDLIRTNATNSMGFVQSVDGYDVTVNEGIGLLNNVNLDPQYIQRVFSPNSLNWKTSGEMLTLTGGEEVDSTDKLNIETIWLKNNQSFDIEFEIILAS